MAHLRLARNISFLVLVLTCVLSGRLGATPRSSTAPLADCTCGVFWVTCTGGDIVCQDIDDDTCGDICSGCSGFSGVGHNSECTDGNSVTCQCNVI